MSIHVLLRFMPRFELRIDATFRRARARNRAREESRRFFASTTLSSPRARVETRSRAMESPTTTRRVCEMTAGERRAHVRALVRARPPPRARARTRARRRRGISRRRRRARGRGEG